MEKLIQVFCTVAAAALLAGCSGKSEDKIPGPVAFDKHDRCHICGMVILNYPGAKAQVFVKGEKEPLNFVPSKTDLSMFCSLRMQNEPWVSGFPTSAIRKISRCMKRCSWLRKLSLMPDQTFAERWANRFFRSLPKKKFKPLRKSTAEQL